MRLLLGLRRLVWDLLGFVLLLVLAGYLAGLAWRHFGPRKPVPGGVRQQLVSDWARQALDDIRTNRTGFTKATFLHFANDPSDLVSDTLRGALEQAGYLHFTQPDVLEKAQRLLELEVSSPASLQEAFDLTRNAAVSLIVFGRVLSFEGTPDHAEFIVEMKLADPAARRVVFERTYQRHWQPSPVEPAAVQHWVGRGPGSRRFLAWAVLVLLLPVFAMSFLRATVRRESNRANLGALLLFTGIDGLLALLLIGLGSLTPGGALAAFACLAAAAFYNLWIMSFALRLES